MAEGSNSNLTWDGPITGSGTLNKAGWGKLILTSDLNDYSGGTVMYRGYIQVGNGGTTGSLGTGPVALNGGSTNSWLIFNRGGTLNVPNIISGSGSGIRMYQRGSGTVVLSGDNSSYGGSVMIDAGTLVAGHANAFGAGNTIINNATMAVASGVTFTRNVSWGGSATLAGKGTYSPAAGPFTLASGRTAAPGIGDVGTLTMGVDTTLDAGSYYSWDHIAGNALGTAGSDFDRLALPGSSLAVTDGAKLKLNFGGTTDFTNVFWDDAREWTLITANAHTGSSAFAGADLSVYISGGSVGSGNAIAGQGSFTTAFSGNNVVLDWTPTGPNQWKDLTGDWTTASNWTDNEVPNAIDATANLLTRPTTPASVVVDAPVTVGTINLNNATNGYTVSGSSAITLQVTSGSAAIAVAGGSHTISAPITLGSDAAVTVSNSGDTLTLSGTISGSGKSLTKNGDGTLLLDSTGGPANSYSGGTTVNGGAVLLAYADALPLNKDLTINTGAAVHEDGNLGSAVQVGSLSISGTGKFNLSDGKLVVNGTVTSDAAVRAYITAGRNGGSWNGSGITSSLATADPVKYAVGYVKNGDLGAGAATTWFGRSVNLDSVLVRLTYAGDADLSGEVTTDDFDKWKYSYAESLPATWYNGDFDYNGTIDTDDFDKWKYAYSFSYPALDAPFAAAVPEPGTLALLALGCAGLWLAGLARRRWVK